MGIPPHLSSGCTPVRRSTLATWPTCFRGPHEATDVTQGAVRAHGRPRGKEGLVERRGLYRQGEFSFLCIKVMVSSNKQFLKEDSALEVLD